MLFATSNTPRLSSRRNDLETFVKMNRFDESRNKFFEQLQVLDDKERIAGLKVSDLSAGKLKLWYHVTFKYPLQRGTIAGSRQSVGILGAHDLGCWNLFALPSVGRFDTLRYS